MSNNNQTEESTEREIDWKKETKYWVPLGTKRSQSTWKQDQNHFPEDKATAHILFQHSSQPPSNQHCLIIDYSWIHIKKITITKKLSYIHIWF